MFENIRNLKAHNLDQTTTLYSAKKLITELAQPIVQLQRNIQQNIESIESQKVKMQSSDQDTKTLAKSLNIEVQHLELRELDKPSTVCTACVEVVKDSENQEKVIYKTHCHEGCKCFGVTPNATSKF